MKTYEYKVKVRLLDKLYSIGTTFETFNNSICLKGSDLKEPVEVWNMRKEVNFLIMFDRFIPIKDCADGTRTFNCGLNNTLEAEYVEKGTEFYIPFTLTCDDSHEVSDLHTLFSFGTKHGLGLLRGGTFTIVAIHAECKEGWDS